MSNATQIGPRRYPLSRLLRVASLGGGIFVLSLLITAARLTPAPAGFGTHQQLGLPPCSSIMLFDRPCPACGMTTSWTHLLHGEIVAAFEANAGGTLLALIALVYVPCSCYFFFRGISTRNEWFSMVMAIALFAAIVASIIQWIVRWNAS